jgi:drug/metabolite transporter (DMT)-like permease
VCFGGAIGIGEVYLFISVFFWTISIIVVDVAVQSYNALDLTVQQFLIATIVCLVVAPCVTEERQYVVSAAFVPTLTKNVWMILGVGFTEACGFLLSTLGQKEVDSARASVLLSMESVAAAVFGAIFLGESLTLVECLGAVTIFLSTLVSKMMHVEIKTMSG